MGESDAEKVEVKEASFVSISDIRKVLELDPLKVFPAGHVMIHHIDITCDGCECEPIIGKRLVISWTILVCFVFRFC